MITYIIIPIFQLKDYKLEYFTIDNKNGIRHLRKIINQAANNTNIENKFNLDDSNLNIFIQSTSGNLYPFFVKTVKNEYEFSFWIFNSSNLGSFSLKEINNEFINKIHNVILKYETKHLIECTSCRIDVDANSLNKYYSGIYCDECWKLIKTRSLEDNHK